MKSEKGVTLITLVIYIIAMCLVLSMLAVISDLFYANTDYIKETAKYVSEYNKFNMYFIEDIKNNKNILTITSDEIVFEDGTTYNYKGSPDNSIYRDKVKICTNIAYCNFTQREQKVNDIVKKIINVHVIINGSKIFETTNEYVLRYW